MKRLSLLLAAVLGCCLFLIQCRPAYSWDKDLEYRLGYDFKKTRAEVTDYIKKYIPEVTDEQIDAWTSSGALEAMTINGDTRYFRNAGRNLFRIDPAAKVRYEAVEGAPSPYEGHSASDAVNIPEVLAGGGGMAAPKRMHVKYSLVVKPNVVPAGKTIRCWLPYPRSDVPRQTDVRFISANHPNPVFSGDVTCHSTLYMEAKAVKDKPTAFIEEFEYTARGEWNDLENAEILPYDKSTELYKRYTSEREKHIVFTPKIKALADSLTAGIDNPYLQAKAMFEYIDANYPWASAREYSTLDNIPEYVIGAHHGDCGQVTLLLITMCRYKGIPAHFQSGFMMHPDAWNMHDWGELYFEGIGWVPVDMSFGIPPFANGNYLSAYPASRYFYLGGIDSYRMYVNTDYSGELIPAKKYPRSETVDFQRGEVEWAGGNLYYPDWTWDMEIEYL
jgi:transglutaminase-like putative cysteine protease